MLFQAANISSNRRTTVTKTYGAQNLKVEYDFQVVASKLAEEAETSLFKQHAVLMGYCTDLESGQDTFERLCKERGFVGNQATKDQDSSDEFRETIKLKKQVKRLFDHNLELGATVKQLKQDLVQMRKTYFDELQAYKSGIQQKLQKENKRDLKAEDAL